MPFAFAGSLVQGQATKSAANTAANAQLEAARIAAEAAKFTPFDIAGSRFATPTYTRDAQGNVIGANLGISPELRAYQDQLSAFGGQQLQQGLMAPQQYAPLQGAAGGLFSLGQQYLAQTPEQAAQKYIEQQQNLLAPSRERQYAQLQNQLFNTGRGGLSVGATGLRPSGAQGLGATSPEMEAYYNALAQQDLQLASQAQQAGQQQTAFGAGLFGTGANLLGQYQAGQSNALSPFQTSLGLQGSIESLGMTPLQVGAELGGRSATAGANAGRYLLAGGLGAAEAMQKANALSPLASGLRSISGSAAGNATNRYLEGQFKKFFNSEPDGGEFGRDTQF
jgi:hypothetical protein